MLKTHEFKAVLSDETLANFFYHSGEIMAKESLALGEIAQELLDSGTQLTNKNIITHLIKALGSTENIIQADVIRKTLEIVVNYTDDDC